MWILLNSKQLILRWVKDKVYPVLVNCHLVLRLQDMFQILDKGGFLPDFFHLFNVTLFLKVLLFWGTFYFAQIATRCVMLTDDVLSIAPAWHELAIMFCFLLNYHLFASSVAFHLLLQSICDELIFFDLFLPGLIGA